MPVAALVRTRTQSHLCYPSPEVITCPLFLPPFRPRASRIYYISRSLIQTSSYLTPSSLHKARVPALVAGPLISFLPTQSTNRQLVDLSHTVIPGSWVELIYQEDWRGFLSFCTSSRETDKFFFSPSKAFFSTSLLIGNVFFFYVEVPFVAAWLVGWRSTYHLDIGTSGDLDPGERLHELCGLCFSAFEDQL